MKRLFLLLMVCCLLGVAACAPRGPGGLFEEKPGARLFRSAQSALDSGQNDQAFALFQEYVQKYPAAARVPDALLQMGIIRARQEKHAQALAYLEQVINSYPESQKAPQALVERLSVMYDTGNFQKVILQASDVFDRKLTDAQFVRAGLIAGDAYMALNIGQGAYHAFLRTYQRAGRKDRQEAVLPRLKAAINLLPQEHIQEELARLDGDFPSSWLLYHQGVNFEASGNFGDAIAVLSDFVDRYPSHELVATARERIAELKSEGYGEKIIIGCLLPLTGKYETFGQRALNGMELAISKSEDAAAGEDALPVQLVVADTGSDPEKAVEAVQELNEKRVTVIVGPLTNAQNAAKQAQSLGIPIITLSQAAGIPEIGEYVFRNFITAGMQVKTLVDYAAKTLDVERFALLYPDESYGETFMNLFWDELLARDASVVGLEKYDPSHTDFSDPIKKLVGLYYEVPEDIAAEVRQPGPFKRENSPFGDLLGLNGQENQGEGSSEAAGLSPVLQNLVDNAPAALADEPQPIVDFGAVFIPDSPEKAGLILPQLAYYDVVDVYCLGTNLWHSERLIEMARRYLQGAVFPAGFFAGSQAEPVKQFVGQYKSLFGSEPEFIEAVSFDTARMVIDLMRRSKYRGRSYIREQLTLMPAHNGVTGRTWFDASGEVVKKLYLLKVSGDRFVEAGDG